MGYKVHRKSSISFLKDSNTIIKNCKIILCSFAALFN